MGRRNWTELFFLDEAVALAAGHRPCFRCRREAAEAFRTAWMAAVGKDASSAAAMDAVLHRERMEHGRKLIHTIPRPPSEFPDGAVIAMSGSAFTVSGGQAFRWTVRTGFLPNGFRVLQRANVGEICCDPGRPVAADGRHGAGHERALARARPRAGHG
jgi:hypothetical protein